MINSGKVFISDSYNPYINIAAEEELMSLTGPDDIILFLWQNDNTIVIGRNQNAWQECDVDKFLSDGGRIARRLSGGGAVYHDLGNLNFTFITSEENYSLDKQLSVIKDAVGKFGVNAEFSGRNDITVSGKKFSGNAFYSHNGIRYHHGTVLISGNFKKLADYLTPSKNKLTSKGIKSVESRVINLNEVSDSVSVDDMKRELINSFDSIYGISSEVVPFETVYSERWKKRYELFGSEEWIFGRFESFDKEFFVRIRNCNLTIRISLSDGNISNVIVFSDGMDGNLIDMIINAFTDSKYKRDELKKRLSDSGFCDDESETILNIMVE